MDIYNYTGTLLPFSNNIWVLVTKHGLRLYLIHSAALFFPVSSLVCLTWEPEASGYT